MREVDEFGLGLENSPRNVNVKKKKNWGRSGFTHPKIVFKYPSKNSIK